MELPICWRMIWSKFFFYFYDFAPWFPQLDLKWSELSPSLHKWCFEVETWKGHFFFILNKSNHYKNKQNAKILWEIKFYSPAWYRPNTWKGMRMLIRGGLPGSQKGGAMKYESEGVANRIRYCPPPKAKDALLVFYFQIPLYRKISNNL